MIVVYSQHALRSLKGRADVKVVNPRFFTAPLPDAQAVYINGDHPAIADAYRKAGVHVFPWGARIPAPLPAPPTSLARSRRRRKSDPAA